MRKGYWIILDELNLAPTDVLEALNRLLDDNRELFVVETQEVIKAHPRFMLFATQNPPGLYGGRKVFHEDNTDNHGQIYWYPVLLSHNATVQWLQLLILYVHVYFTGLFRAEKRRGFTSSSRENIFLNITTECGDLWLCCL